MTMYWYGGSSYAAFDLNSKRDAENFDTLRSAIRAFANRADADPYYPCVDNVAPDDGGPTAWLFKGENIIGGDYPDFTLSFGPRGGVHINRS